MDEETTNSTTTITSSSSSSSSTTTTTTITTTTTASASGDEKGVGREATSRPITTPLITSPSTKLTHAELLCSRFLKNISTQGSDQCKYPNPEVPEFCPRKMLDVVRTEVSHETGDSACGANIATSCTTINTLNKNELVISRMTSEQCFKDFRNSKQPTPVVDPARLQSFTHCYWTFHDPNLVAFERTPHVLNFNKSHGLTITDLRSPFKSLEDLRIELSTKNQQLSHMNSVVKALLEEIWKINETTTRQKLREQESADLSCSIEQYLKPSPNNEANCQDCCNKLRTFAGQVSKQVERKIMKMHNQHKNNFVEGILSVIESSLQMLTQTHPQPHTQSQPQIQNQLHNEEDIRRKDASTQTNTIFYDESISSVAGSAWGNYFGNRADLNRSKQQMTRVYRNRNYYKYEIPNPNAQINMSWGQEQGIQEPKMWRTNFFTPRVTPTTRLNYEGHGPSNPIQLIHQRFKNLNCRLEGIPEKNLVKFSYIVDGNEYSAIAATKKEAQYHCAWHVLNSCKE